MFEIRLGTVLGPDPRQIGRPLALAATEWFEHALILGRTGSGKSRLLNQIVRQHLEKRIGLVLIDPDSDLVEDILAYAVRRDVETGDRFLRRIHLLESSPFLSFRYDPFRFFLPRPVHPELLDSVRAAWLHCKVQRVAEVLQRNNGQTDFEGMPRLHRVLTNVLYAVGTLVDRRHLPLADAAVLLDVHSEVGRQVYRRVAHLLPRDVRADFEILVQMRRVEDLRKETESTINRLRTLFGPVVQSVFSGDGSEPGFNLFDVVQKGHVVLVSLRDTPYFSGEQARALGNLLIYDAMTTAMITPRQMRRPLTLVIDEAAEYVTPDLSTILRRGRKYQLSLVLAAQSLQSFKKETYDLRPIVLGQPRTIVCMNQRWPDDLDLLARVLFTGRLDFTELVHEVERDGGVEWVTQEEHSYSRQDGENWTDTTGTQEGESVTHQEGTSRAEQRGWQHGSSRQEQTSSSQSQSDSRGHGESRGLSESPILEAGRVLELLRLAGAQESDQTGSSSGTTDGRSLSEGESESVSGSTSLSSQRSTALGTTKGRSASSSTGGARTEGHSVAHRHAQVRRVLRELQRTGQLEMSLADQLMRFAQRLFSLQRREAVVLSGNDAIDLLTAEVPDPFVSAEALVRAAEWAKRRLMELRPYLFVPDLTPAETERRLKSLLDEGGEVPEESDFAIDAADPLA